jgi:hypothetical protein
MALTQSDGHSAQTEVCFEAELHAVQFEDDALGVLQPRHFRAADWI